MDHRTVGCDGRSAYQLRDTRFGSLQISDDERIGMLRRRPPLRQKQRGEKEAVVWQFNDPDVALSADTGDGQSTSLQVFTKCRIEAVVTKILGHDLRRLTNAMRQAPGCQMNGLSLSHQ